MLKTLFFVSLFFVNFSFLPAQSISGNFNRLAGQAIRLEGFNGLQTYLISQTTLNNQGEFELQYSQQDYGVGFIVSADNKPVFLILCGEDIRITGDALSLTETITIQQGLENIFFDQFAREQARREQALNAWSFLQRMYQKDSLFSTQRIPQEAIHAEKQRISEEEQAFLNRIPPQAYVRWFLPIRKLTSSVSAIAQHRSEEVPQVIKIFRSLDYTDPRLYKSGLFKNVLESHIWLLENSGRSLDSVFQEMKISIDHIVSSLLADEKILNEVTDFLFDLLEKHSLFQASEYLALKVLNEVSCTIDQNLAKQLETYRAMKKGNTAPDFALAGDVLPSGKVHPARLSDIKAQYTLVVFAASWCQKCREEIPLIARKYADWQKHGLEVVLVSIDDEKDAFRAFAKDLPFSAICDYRKWNSPVAEAYYVFGTPTMFLLDKQRTILLRPNSVNQMDAWIDWFVVKGKPLPRN
jgi:peroxiredoxin